MLCQLHLRSSATASSHTVCCFKIENQHSAYTPQSRPPTRSPNLAPKCVKNLVSEEAPLPNVAHCPRCRTEEFELQIGPVPGHAPSNGTSPYLTLPALQHKGHCITHSHSECDRWLTSLTMFSFQKSGQHHISRRHLRYIDPTSISSDMPTR